MILVTLGTHPAPMDRLLTAFDRLLATGAIDDQVVVQAAAYRARPARLELRGTLPAAELERLLAAADVVVSHAGPGALADARRAGRAPVVVPRDPRFGEHVDDHQLRYAARLHGTPGYHVVTDLTALASAIAAARADGGQPARPDLARALIALRAFVPLR